jgi:hypothetical protein
MQTHTRIDLWPDAPAFDIVLCDSRMPDGSDGDCCARGYLRCALADFKAQTWIARLLQPQARS